MSITGKLKHDNFVRSLLVAFDLCDTNYSISNIKSTLLKGYVYSMHEGDSLRSSLNFNLLGARLPPLDSFDLSCERGVIASITVPMEVPTESNLQQKSYP